MDNDNYIIDVIDTIYVHNEHYFKPMENNITCDICTNILNDPIGCKTCNNYYCSKCIKEWNKFSNKQHKCPNKCKISNLTHETRTIRKFLAGLKFNCMKDCNKIINYDEYLKHVNLCEGQLDKCPVCCSLVKKGCINERLIIEEKESKFDQVTSMLETANKTILDLNEVINNMSNEIALLKNELGNKQSKINELEIEVKKISSYNDKNIIKLIV